MGKELGEYEVQEIGRPITIVQVLAEQLKDRAAKFGDFEFLTPEEKQQAALKEKLSTMQEENDRLQVRLSATEEQAKKARDKALALNSFLQQARENMRQTVGAQIQEALSEMAKLIAENENTQADLELANKQLANARNVMNNMNAKLKELSQKNTVLTSEVSISQVEQETLRVEIDRLQAIIDQGPKVKVVEKPPKKRLIYKILPSLDPSGYGRPMPPEQQKKKTFGQIGHCFQTS